MPNNIGSLIHASNPNISAFLPPASEFPDLTLDPVLLRDEVNFAALVFEKIQQVHPDLDKIAIELEDHDVSFRQLIGRSNGIANFLYSRGIKNGDRILILVDFVSSSLEAIFGVTLTGAIACQDIPHTTERVLYHLKSLNPKFVFVDTSITSPSLIIENSQEAIVIIANPKPVANSQGHDRILYLEDILLASSSTFPHRLTTGGTIATMFHTSGSTGMPKGCLATHASWVQLFKEANSDLNSLSSVFINAKFYPILPTGAYGFSSSVLLLYMGGALVFSKEKDVLTVLTNLRKGVTSIAGVPPFYNSMRMFIEENTDKWKQSASSLKTCVCAGETHTASFAKAWKEASGLDLLSGYGSTETQSVIANSPRDIVPGSMGKARRFAQIEILDSNYNVAPLDTPGLIAFKTIFGCIYWNNQEKQSYYVRNGWNIPRDICKKDKDGNFWFIGREDDLIITKSGGNVSALEIEGIVLADPRVKEVAVVGKRAVEDREDGKLTLITAFIVTGLNESEHATLQKDLKNSVGKHSEFTLDQIEFIEILPKLPNGKINRKTLK